MRQALLIIFLLATAVACQAAKPDPAAEATARALYDDLRQGHEESMLSRMPAGLRTAPVLAGVSRLRTLIPMAEPASSRVVRVAAQQSRKGVGAETIAIEYDYPGRAILLTAAMSRPAGAPGWQVNTFQLQSGDDAQLAANGFSLAGKSPTQLAFLAYAVLVPLLMLAAIVKVVTTSGLQYRWLWIALTLIGVCGLDMNWTTGALRVNWYAIELIGSGVARGASRFDPWVLSATVPLGALLILGGLVASPRRARKAAGP